MAFSFRAIRGFLLTTLVLGALYFATRLINLTILPIFTDEAIYIRWSQIGSRDAEWRFISLVDGKQPMFTWIMMGLLRFIQDPLVAGRMVSVIAGFISAIGLWMLSFELFKSKKVSFTTVALYIITPFALMYDRLAMYDSLVAAFSIWSLYLGILLVRHIRLDVALLLGMCLGAGMLNKTSGFLSLYLLPLTLILFDWRGKDRKAQFFRWMGLAIVAAILSQMMYAILRLSPLFAMVGQKDLVFVYSAQELFAHPFKFLVGNIRGLFDWLTHYLTWPVFISALIPLLWIKKAWRETVLLVAWWLVPFIGLAQFGRVLYPRFILFMAMPLLILAARVLVRLIWTKRTLMTYVLIAVICVPSILSSYFILTNPLHAPIPFSDKSQLIDDWPSGWGVSEVNAFITKESQAQDIAVFTEGTFGLFPYAIEMYQVDNPRVVVKGLWPVPQTIPEDIEKIAKEKPTYIIFNQTQTIPPWPLTFVAQYQKGNRKDVFMRLYRITPDTKENVRRP